MATNPNPQTPLPQLSRSVSITVSSRVVASSVSADDTKILKQIQASHAHDAREVDVKPILDVIEDIFHRAKPTTLAALIVDGAQDLSDVLEAKMGGAAAGPKGNMPDALAVTIQKVCCESLLIFCKIDESTVWSPTLVLRIRSEYECTPLSFGSTILKFNHKFTCQCTGGDAHTSTMAILNMLGNYSWDAKVVIALAAFAATYGELWLVMLLSDTNPLARSIAVLKQIPEISEIKGVLKPQFAPLNDLIKVMVDVAKSLIEFRLLPSKYISPDDVPLATSFNQIAITTYWTIRSVGDYLSNRGMGPFKLGSQRDKLAEETFNNLVLLFETPQKDNVRILKSLIYAREDIQPLVKIISGKQVHIDVLRGKTVLLLISDLDLIDEELIVLDKMYKEAKKGKNRLEYEIVWLPVVDRTINWTKEHETKFKELQYKMSWYTLFHPSLLDVASIRFIKEVWRFAKKPVIVSLDSAGKVVSENALHMILIWGNSAYPFTTIKEEELWKKQTWRLDFVVDAIHPEFPKWISQGDAHICLFGGENIEWIRKFTTSMKEHCSKIGIKIELVYVGKHNAKEAVKKIMEVINSEKLAHTLPDLTQVWYFWTRLESMLYSKMHHGKNVENDTIVKEVMSVLSFDGGDQGWGFIGSGSKTEIVKGKGEVILSCFSRNKEWEERHKKVGFLAAFFEFIQREFQMSSHHCNRLVLPSIEGAGVPKVVACADCGRPMEKYILYRCCTGY
ncbi:hypothetical protein Cgig2_004441 [Carnegiea gigantea]|uniref:Protein SIEVE ELEMENT OCCLUSION B-like n=1 Tax=Carnegiea gigantea TaxID=171969 RepID=A0A9Q1JUW6_9CARY|nr:hypothetical protein Cgig2_004441 [Carnegiea gigantea]